MKVLVTGGTGFIGSAIVDKLIDQGNEVTVFAGHINVLNSNSRASYMEGDILSAKNLAEILDNHDIVIHAAGLSGIGPVNTNPDKSLKLNVLSVYNVLEAMRGKSISRFLLVSSSAVYGKPESLPVTEESNPNPVSLYGLHKYMAEKIAEFYSNLFDMEITIARLFNVFGPRENNLFKLLVSRACRNETVNIYGQDKLRDFICVDDAALAIAGLINTRNKFEVYNIGTGKGRKIAGIIKVAEEIIPGLKVTYTPSEQELYDSVADTAKIKKAIDFNPDCTDEKIRQMFISLYSEYQKSHN